MPVLERSAGTRFWTYYRQAKRNTRSPDETQADLQVRSATQILRHAAQNVPYWRERLDLQTLPLTIDKESFDEVFRRVPITTKSDLRLGFPDQVTSDAVRDTWRYGSSAGTVDRITIVSDFSKRDYIRATNLRIMDAVLGNPLAAKIVDIPPDACNVVCALRDEGPLGLLPFVKMGIQKGNPF